MAPRILLAADAPGAVAAIRKGAAAAAARVDACAIEEAPGRLEPGVHLAAIVRASGPARDVVAALRKADPGLPILALFRDDTEARADPDLLGADGCLVGPLAVSAVAGAIRTAARLRNALREAAAARDEAARSEASRAQAMALARTVGRPGTAVDGKDPALELLKRVMVLEVKRSRRYRLPVSLALLGVDGWPEVVAALPLAERASALAGVLGAVASALRDIDLAAPFHEDRMVVLMPHTARSGAMQVAGRLVSRVRRLGGKVPLTASVGVASHEGEAQGTVSFAGLVKRAAEALSRARAAGGDQAAASGPARKRERIVMG